VHEAAPVEQAKTIAKSLRLVEPMGADDNALGLFFCLRNEVKDDFAADHVQAAGRLVEQQDGRIVDHRASEIHPLLLPSREGGAAAVDETGQVEELTKASHVLSRRLVIEAIHIGKEQE
jgi:hypothetical protein